MLIVSDVHAAFEALAGVAGAGETLLILGDLINLVDYRTGEGAVAEVLGPEFGRRSAALRGAGDYAGMRALWVETIGGRWEEVRAAIDEAVRRQYQEMADALDGATGYVTFGNVDRPDQLAAALPSGMTFVDGDVVEIDGLRFGFVGGGVETPLRAAGEVTDEEMAEKLSGLGAVDVLCSHLPPAVPALHTDVVTGRRERASRPILEYLRSVRPRYHFFGDVHQPQAHRWRVGSTLCVNVGYFRATRRAIRFDPVDGPASTRVVGR